MFRISKPYEHGIIAEKSFINMIEVVVIVVDLFYAWARVGNVQDPLGVEGGPHGVAGAVYIVQMPMRPGAIG